jgi:hypothetical protein
VTDGLYERDEVWGSTARRTLRFAHPDAHASVSPETGADLGRASVEANRTDAFGPEAVVRARAMDYELTTRIQQESPYAQETVVEHRVHDYRLYVGMWVVAGLSGVSAFLTYSLWHLLITVVAVAFALMSSPGRQYAD